MNNSFKELAKVIKKASKIAVFTHISPDSDALGSSLGLAYALKTLNKDVNVFIKDKFVEYQTMLFDQDLVINEKCNPENYDLMISVDVPSIIRLGDYANAFINFSNTIVLDHHKTLDLNPMYRYVDLESSSCCEIVYFLLKALKIKITKKISTYLYAGLSSDTGSFVNTNVNENSFVVARELYQLGADIALVNEIQYRTRTKKEVEFTKYLWSNFVEYKKCAYCLVDYETLKSMKGKKTDCDCFSSELVSIKGIRYSFSLVEFEKNLFALSMRAKSGENVRNIAEKLGGGGHICAAGAKFKAESMEEAKNKVLKALFSK